MTRFTEAKIDHIVELLKGGVPLPKELRWKIAFDDEPDEVHGNIGKQPLHRNLKNLIGTDLARKGHIRSIRAIASSDIRVLIEGENGTGKRLTARTIHETGSRENGYFIMVDCSSLSESQ